MQFHFPVLKSRKESKFLTFRQFMHIEARRCLSQNLFSGKHPTNQHSTPMLQCSAPAVLINTHATNPEQRVTTLHRISSKDHSQQTLMVLNEREQRPSFRTQGMHTTFLRAKYFNRDLCQVKIYTRRVRLFFSTPSERGESFKN